MDKNIHAALVVIPSGETPETILTKDVEGKELDQLVVSFIIGERDLSSLDDFCNHYMAPIFAAIKRALADKGRDVK